MKTWIRLSVFSLYVYLVLRIPELANITLDPIQAGLYLTWSVVILALVVGIWTVCLAYVRRSRSAEPTVGQLYRKGQYRVVDIGLRRAAR